MKFPKGIHKTRKPKMKEHRGRTWDSCKVILPNKLEIEGYLDTTWGTRFYFPYENNWYVGGLFEWDNSGGRGSVCCDLTQQPRVSLI